MQNIMKIEENIGEGEMMTAPLQFFFLLNKINNYLLFEDKILDEYGKNQ